MISLSLSFFLSHLTFGDSLKFSKGIKSILFLRQQNVKPLLFSLLINGLGSSWQ